MTSEDCPFAGLIDGTRRGMPWGTFPTRASAESAAQKLRNHGIAARVVCPVEPLEGFWEDAP
jgi:hypothetical protein